MADAGYWRDRVSASGAQNPEEFADVLSVDKLPPIHAGSKASPEYEREFRALMNEARSDGANPPNSEIMDELRQLGLEFSELPAGERIIKCFAGQHGEVIIGLPLKTEAS